MREAIVPKEVVHRLLREGAKRLVLVGGQALKLWVDRYEVSLPADLAYVSRDVDFLAESASDAEVVRALARALGGRAVFPKVRAALTALVGQAVREISEDEVFNVDVVHRVFGAGDAVRTRAVLVEIEPDLALRVMHPLDVLKSRLDNLHGLAEKRNELGRAQLRAAIAVTQAFLREASASEGKGRRPVTLRYVSFIEHLAAGTAGRRGATRDRIHVADAIEPAAVPSNAFHTRKLPELVRWMSPERRAELALGS